MPSECSLGGFYLRKCASDQRPPVKAGTKPRETPRKKAAPKKKRVNMKKVDEAVKKTVAEFTPEKEAEQPARRMTRSMTSKGEGVEGGATIRRGKDGKMTAEPYRRPVEGDIIAMPTIPLKEMSPNQRSRLRNGHPVRVAMGSGADGCSCKMKEENIKKVMRKKGGAATIKLDADEIRENKISGSGIMSGARKGLKEAKEKLGGAVKIGKAKFGKPSVDRAKKNLGIGGAIGGISLAEVKTAIKNKDQKVVDNYIQQSGKVVEKIDKKKNPTTADLKAVQRINRELQTLQKLGVSSISDPTIWQRVTDVVSKVIKDISGIIGITGAGVSDDEEEGGSLRYGEGGSLGYGMPKRMMGGAIGRSSTGSQISNVGAGGNILGPMQASKAPQASSANWFFSTQFPPAMAREIRG